MLIYSIDHGILDVNNKIVGVRGPYNLHIINGKRASQKRHF